MATTEACRHPRKPHTVWYWIDDPNDPVPAPYSVTLDNRADAMATIEGWLDAPHRRLRWIKAFRADNEAYECFRWENPEPLPEPEPIIVPLTPKNRRTLLGRLVRRA